MTATLTTKFVFFKTRRNWYLRLLVSVVFVSVAWGAGLHDARPASADTGCALVRCVLACNTRTQLCSRYPVGKVPHGYTIRRSAPPGHVVVRGFTACDRRICIEPSPCPLTLVAP